MEITVHLFAALRERTGAEAVRLPWTEGMTCRDVKVFLKESFGSAGPLVECSLVAVNGEYASDRLILAPEDEVAVLPPVSGG